MLHIAAMVEQCPDVAWLFTAGIDEACLVRAQGCSKPILALAYSSNLFEEAINNTIDVAIYDHETVKALNACAAQLKKKARVHIKVDTGMSRLGVLPAEVVQFVENIQACYKNIEVYGIFTHLADTNNSDLSYTHNQLAQFDAVVEQLAGTGICSHVLASGSLFLPQKYPLVRVGTSLYGFWKSAVQKKRFQDKFPDLELQPVLTWKTRIIQIKTIPAGCSVGYNRTFFSSRQTTIAILPIGYADGYSRELSNKSHVIINGCPAPILGMVTMNLTVVDITDIADVTVGTEVILLGNYPGITATDLAQKLGTINNEIVTRISPTIPRF